MSPEIHEHITLISPDILGEVQVTKKKVFSALTGIIKGISPGPQGPPQSRAGLSAQCQTCYSHADISATPGLSNETRCLCLDS